MPDGLYLPCTCGGLIDVLAQCDDNSATYDDDGKRVFASDVWLISWLCCPSCGRGMALEYYEVKDGPTVTDPQGRKVTVPVRKGRDADA